MANNVTYRVYVEKIGGRQVDEFIGLPGEMFYDPGKGELRLSDGVTPGGVNTTISTETSDDVARDVAAAAFEKANGAAQEAFITVNVTGQANIVATSNADMLRFAPGAGVTLTTDAGNNTLTISAIANDVYARTHSNAAFALANVRAGNAFSVIAVQDKGNLTAVTNADIVVLSPGAGIDMQGQDNTIIIRSSINAFSTIVVAGQNNVVADANADTLTLVAGGGVSITTNSITDTITIGANTIDQYARDHANGAFGVANLRPIVVYQSATSILAPNTSGFQTVTTVTVPGGAMGPNGWVECFATWTMGGSSNNKVLGIRALGPASQAITTVTATNHISFHQAGIIFNRGVTNQQMSTPPQQFYYGASASANINTNHVINTENNWDIHFSVNKTTANDRVTLEQHRVVVQYVP